MSSNGSMAADGIIAASGPAGGSPTESGIPAAGVSVAGASAAISKSAGVTTAGHGTFVCFVDAARGSMTARAKTRHKMSFFIHYPFCPPTYRLPTTYSYNLPFFFGVGNTRFSHKTKPPPEHIIYRRRCLSCLFSIPVGCSSLRSRSVCSHAARPVGRCLPVPVRRLLRRLHFPHRFRRAADAAVSGRRHPDIFL